MIILWSQNKQVFKKKSSMSSKLLNHFPINPFSFKFSLISSETVWLPPDKQIQAALRTTVTGMWQAFTVCFQSWAYYRIVLAHLSFTCDEGESKVILCFISVSVTCVCNSGTFKTDRRTDSCLRWKSDEENALLIFISHQWDAKWTAQYDIISSSS